MGYQGENTQIHLLGLETEMAECSWRCGQWEVSGATGKLPIGVDGKVGARVHFERAALSANVR